MMGELTPCPCCNTNDWLYSQPQFFKVSEQHSTPIGWVTMCNKCGVKVEKYSKQECEEAWNTRPREDALRSELDQLREQMRWRKYPEEKPELGKAYLVRYLFSITYLTETPTADWISRGTFDVFGDGKWTVDSQTPLKVVIVTHFRELPQPPEEA